MADRNHQNACGLSEDRQFFLVKLGYIHCKASTDNVTL